MPQQLLSSIEETPDAGAQPALTVPGISWEAEVAGADAGIPGRVPGESELSRFFEASPTPMAIWGLDGRVRKANPAWEPILGFTASELEGIAILDLVHPEDRAGAIAEFEALVASGKGGGFDCRGRCKDGSYRWLLLSAVVCEDAGAIYATAHDITARKMAEDALRDSESLFRSAFDNSLLGMSIAGLDGRYLQVNQRLSEMTGFSERELLQRGFDAITHPDNLTRDLELLRSLREGEALSGVVTKRYVRKDGSAIWARVHVAVVRDGQGKPLHCMTLAEDLTDQKCAEEAARTSEERMKVALDAAGIGICYRDLDEIYASESQFRLYGLEPSDEWIPRDRWLQSIHPGDRERVRSEQRLAIEAGEPYDIEFRVVWPDGSVHWLLNQGRVFHEGGTVRRTEITLDITERKATEAYHDLRNEVLQVLNGPGTFDDSIQLVLAKLRDRTGFDAVGIRLRDGEDYPYAAQQGFPESFLLTEDTLIQRDANGCACRDSAGKPRLECTCGLVISGHTDSSNPHFTPGGSFWINDSLPLLDLPPDKDPRLHPRNLCIRERYASIALVPIRTKDRIVGLVQFNDRRKDRFSPAVVAEFEGIAAHLGEALMRRRAEESLAIERDLLSTLIEGVPDHIYFKDLESRFIRVNRAMAETFGRREPAEILGKTDFDFFAAEHATRALADERALLEGRKSVVSNEERESWPDGRESWVQTTKFVMRDDSGRVTGTCGISRDITERKQAETALAHEARRRRTIFESSRDGIVIVDKTGKVVESNQSFAGMLGYNMAEMLQLHIWDWDAQMGRDQILESLSRPGDPRPPVFTTRHRRKDGSLYDAEISSVSAQCCGEIVYQSVVRDVTERKRMEEAIRAHSEKLARSNEELERFAYVASHDLQEPLRMVASFTQLLSKKYSGQLDETADRYINFAVDGAKRMQQLITDLLAYSRVNNKELAPRPMECDAVVQIALQNLKVAIEEAGAVVECDPLPALAADPAQLGQLFQNLIGNALKFHGPAPPRVHIAAADQGGDWLFSVKDNGIGIAPEQADRVFRIFQRLHTRTEYPGTGIGLAVCKKVVERHGGRIWVESQPGAGSSFCFTLPKAQGAAGE
jgi:PAS domain S-box-containing protein